MSDLKVTVERLEVFEHPNADALELAQVGLFRAVVPKGVYKTGELALYIPEQAVLPDALIEELGLTGRLAGSAKNRVKAMRLRGELSQGIVCRPEGVPFKWDAMREVWEWANSVAPEEMQPLVPEGDFAEALGIVKWVPPIPPQMAGQVQAAPQLVRWIDIENIKRYPGIFEPGEPVVATEKIHGTCCLYTWNDETREQWVSSKGVGAQSLALQEDTRNLYWRAVQTHNLRTYASFLAKYFHTDVIGLFGEVFGKGVQDLHYGADAGSDATLGYRLFDVACMRNGERVWINTSELDKLWELMAPDGMIQLERVPVVYRGPYDYDLIAGLAEGRSMLDEDTIREGVVVRPAVERHSPVLGGRAIAKFVSTAYLERKGATTEYE